MKLCPVCNAEFATDEVNCPQDGGLLISEDLDLTGMVLNDLYEVKEEISSDLTTVTYAAQHRHLGRPVRIRVLKAALHHDPSARESFRQQMRHYSQTAGIDVRQFAHNAGPGGMTLVDVRTHNGIQYGVFLTNSDN
jgi:hypothetical protein